MPQVIDAAIRSHLQQGAVIPAHPLALDDSGRLSERHQKALTRYYLAAGAGGVAVGVHTTQFQIRRHGLLAPVLELAADTARQHVGPKRPVLVAGVCGPLSQACQEAELAKCLGYDLGLVSLGGLDQLTEAQLVEHLRAVAEIIPVFGFYLQPAVGGRSLSHPFWQQVVELQGVVAIKVAPFDRYATLDVIRAVSESTRRDEIALYTGNDDNIVGDLLTEYRFRTENGASVLRFAGGLLGHWAYWTSKAVALLAAVQAARCGDRDQTVRLMALASQVTDANAAIFDARHGFSGCIPGIQEILRRQGLVPSRRCLDPAEHLSPGQLGEIDRVCSSYPDLMDDEFVRLHLDEWLS